MSDSLSKDCNKLEDELKIYLQDSTKVPDAEFEIESLSHITKVNDPSKLILIIAMNHHVMRVIIIIVIQ